MSAPSFKPAQLAALEQFIRIVKDNPQVLHTPQLRFFKEYLESMNATIPSPPAPEPEPTPAHEPEVEMDTETPPAPEPKEEPESESESESDVALPEDVEIAFVENPAEEPELFMPDSETEVTEDMIDAAIAAKAEALEKQAAGDLGAALECFTRALMNNPKSTILLGNRGLCLLKMNRPLSAVKDGELAIRMNPDSPKGYKIRGTARMMLGQWEDAHRDLAQSNQLDFDEDVQEKLKLLGKKVARIHAIQALERRREQRQRVKEQKRKLKERKANQEKYRRMREEEMKREQEARAKQSHGMPGGMPDMSGMGGMPDMGGASEGSPNLGGMGGMDPDLMAALNDPTFMAALQDPTKLRELMKDPKYAPLLAKLQQMAGGMGGMGGMPMGMGGL